MTVSSKDLIRATSGGGHFRIGMRDGNCVRLCLLCDCSFEQSDEGFDAMKRHEFEHGMGTLFDWTEIHGKHLRLVVIAYDTELKALYSSEADLYGIDDETGTVYHLTHQYAASYRNEAGGWKWKIGKPTRQGSGLNAMPAVVALLSNGSKNKGEK